MCWLGLICTEPKIFILSSTCLKKPLYKLLHRHIYKLNTMHKYAQMFRHVYALCICTHTHANPDPSNRSECAIKRLHSVMSLCFDLRRNAYHSCSCSSLLLYILSKHQYWKIPGFSQPTPTELQNWRFTLLLWSRTALKIHKHTHT